MFADFLNNIILYPFFIVFVRLGGIFMTFPFLSDKYISIKIRLSLLLMITLALAPAVSQFVGTPPVAISGLSLVIFKELLIGILLGLGARLFMFAINIAGDFMAANMGLQSASMFDPTTQSNSTAVSRLISIIALLAFISLDFHLYIIQAFIESYNLIEFNSNLDKGAVMLAIISSVTKLTVLGVKMASPVVATNLIINLSLGVLNRLIPQIHVFFISMPLTMLIGVFILVLSITSMLVLFTEEIGNNIIIFSQEIN